MNQQQIQQKTINKIYVKRKKLSGGAYGKIYVCIQIGPIVKEKIFPWRKQSVDSDFQQKTVVIKKFRIMKKKIGLDIDSLREIKFLNYLKHPNIVDIKQWFLKPSKKQNDYNYKSLCFVTDYMVSLDTFIQMYIVEKINEMDIKKIMFQVLSGLDFLHSNLVLHRDVKPENILINSQGIIKITDFGLSRIWDLKMTKQVCTMNFRAPELFFGSDKYSPAVDMWAAGCVFAQLYLQKIFFEGQSEHQVLSNIINILGNPTEENWPQLYKMPIVYQYETREPMILKKLISDMSKEGIDLLKLMLKYNPIERCTAKEALKSEYFNDLDKEELYRYSHKAQRIINQKLNEQI